MISFSCVSFNILRLSLSIGFTVAHNQVWHHSVLRSEKALKSENNPDYAFPTPPFMATVIPSFISKWECMNAAYRSSMEDVCVVSPALQNDSDIFFAALMDGHGGCATASFVASRIGENLGKALHEKDLNCRGGSNSLCLLADGCGMPYGKPDGKRFHLRLRPHHARQVLGKLHSLRCQHWR